MNFLQKTYNPMIVVPILGVLSAYYFGITHTLWAVTGEFTRWGVNIVTMLGYDMSEYSYVKLIKNSGTVFDRMAGVMILGMFLGAFVAAVLSNNIKFRMPTSKTRIFQALFGGILAGFGARLSMGCNLAAFFTGIPQFSLHAWYFTVFTLIGTYIGVKIIKLPMFQTKCKLQKSSNLKFVQKNTKTRNIILLTISAVFIVAFIYFESNIKSIFGIAVVFGLVFGFLLEKGQVCFTSAFRDLWLTGRSQMAVAIFTAILISSIGNYAFIQNGVNPKIAWAGLNAVLGGLLFGIGIVIAGGCETGWMYRSVEGQVHYWFVGLGNVIGAVLLVLVWDYISPVLATNFDKVNLLSSFGNYGGLAITYIALILMLAFIFWYEKIYFKRLKNARS